MHTIRIEGLDPNAWSATIGRFEREEDAKLALKTLTLRDDRRAKVEAVAA